jgi:hypothetical protein
MGMAVLKPHRTGLPFELAVSERAYAGSQHHRPRVKVLDRDGQLDATVAIDDTVEVLAGTPIIGMAWKDLTEYIQANRVLLLALWNEEIDQVTYVERQRKVG